MSKKRIVKRRNPRSCHPASVIRAAAAVVVLLAPKNVVKRGSIGLVGLVAALAVCLAPVVGGEDRETLLRDGEVIAQGNNLIFEEDSYPRKPAKLIDGPTVSTNKDQVTIGFRLDTPDDVSVRIMDNVGKTIRHLAHGVLGPNAPEPFQKASLIQRIVWDGRDDDGNPVPIDSCRVRVEVGLTPTFERFVGHDPRMIGLYVTGIETDHKGRVYVASVNHFGQGTVKRFDTGGAYLETVFPPNPTSLHALGEKAEEVFDWDVVDGKRIPRRAGLHISYVVGGPWSPWYPHPKVGDIDEMSYWQSFPLRISRDGRAYLVGNNPGWAPSRVKRPLPFVLYRVPSLDPCWMLERLRFYSQAWTIDRQGYGYWAQGGKLHKFKLDTGELAADFSYNGKTHYKAKRPVIGSTQVERKGTHLGPVKDLAVDDVGNILMVNVQKEGVQVYKPNGQSERPLSVVPVGDRQLTLRSVHGIRSVPNAVYILADVAGIDDKRILLKMSGNVLNPRGIWFVEVGPMSRHVAVDTTRQPALAWVGNGNGLATVSRIVDEGTAAGEVRHYGGSAQRTFAAPYAIALDASGRLYVYDRASKRIVRTNDDGSEWVELSNEVGDVQSMLIDKKRDLVYVDTRKGVFRYDLGFEHKRLLGPPSLRLGGVDAEGNFYAAAAGGRQDRTSRVAKYGSDGRLKEREHCTLHLGGSLAVDKDGSVYVMDTAAIPFDAMHNAQGGYSRGGEEFSAGWRTSYLVRFASGGGKRGGTGEVWAHLGVSSVPGHCKCWDSIYVTLDEAGRIFATDRDRFHIKVLDKAGNLVGRIGGWGNTDSPASAHMSSPPAVGFSSPLSPVAGKGTLYVADAHLFLVAKIRLGYRQAKEAAIKRPME